MNVSLIYFSRQSRGFDTSLLVIWHSSGMYTFWDRCDINNGLRPGKQEALQEDGAKLLTVMDFQERSVSPAARIWGCPFLHHWRSPYRNTPNSKPGNPQLPVLEVLTPPDL